MNRYPIKQVDITATILSGGTAGSSADIPADLNGLIRAIYINAPDLTSTNTYTITIAGPKTGQTLYSKASLTKNAKTNILVDANNYPLQIPFATSGVITVTSSGAEGADRAFGITLLVERG